MLWLNPADNQGVRFLIDDVRNGADLPHRLLGRHAMKAIIYNRQDRVR
jgi:hypothetical protein